MDAADQLSTPSRMGSRRLKSTELGTPTSRRINDLLAMESPQSFDSPRTADTASPRLPILSPHRPASTTKEILVSEAKLLSLSRRIKNQGKRIDYLTKKIQKAKWNLALETQNCADTHNDLLQGEKKNRKQLKKHAQEIREYQARESKWYREERE